MSCADTISREWRVAGLAESQRNIKESGEEKNFIDKN